jgi:hypothetical protein
MDSSPMKAGFSSIAASHHGRRRIFWRKTGVRQSLGWVDGLVLVDMDVCASAEMRVAFERERQALQHGLGHAKRPRGTGKA